MAMPTVRDVHVDAVLTNISIGYKNPNYIADQIFPTVTVNKKSDYFFTFDKGSWLRDEVAPRAPGTRARLMDYTVTTGSYNCITYAIAKEISDEVRANADSPLRPDVDAADFVTDALLRAHELRVANLTTAGSGKWVYSTTPSTAWTSDVSDPWGDIDSLINGVVASIGQLPTVMVMSWDVWRNLRQHPDFLDRVKYTRPTGRVEPSDLSSWFGIPKVLIGTQLYTPSREGETTSASFIWGDQVWVGYVPPSPALMTPAAGYTFEWSKRQVSRFRLDPEHSDLIEASHSVDARISASDAGGVLYGCV